MNIDIDEKIMINKFKTYDLYKKYVDPIINHVKTDICTINKPLYDYMTQLVQFVSIYTFFKFYKYVNYL